MKNEIKKLKSSVNSLEKLAQAGEEVDLDVLNMYIRRIKSTCDLIKNKANESSNARIYTKDLTKEYKCINTLNFMYKPIEQANIDNFNYLQRFSQERLEQLKSANALSEHNSFWQNHNTISGNVYGSVPIDLISLKSKQLLRQHGWRQVSVNILDFHSGYDNKREIIRYCDEAFDYYVLILEKETNSHLVLNYEI